MKAKERLIIALDVDNISEAKDIVNEIDEECLFYKIGLQLFVKEGYKAIEFLKQKNKKIFLDLKFHDIPNTVINAIKNAFNMEIDMLTIHSTGGFEMMEGVAKLLWQWKDHGKEPPIVLGVTLLTSLDGAFLEDIIGTTNRTIDEEVVILAKAVKSAGLPGVIASPKEIKNIKNACGEDFIVVSPGIRPVNYTQIDDQARTATPEDAIKNGADYIVVGRPIIKSDNKKQATIDIIKQIQEGVNG